MTTLVRFTFDLDEQVRRFGKYPAKVWYGEGAESKDQITAWAAVVFGFNVEQRSQIQARVVRVLCTTEQFSRFLIIR